MARKYLTSLINSNFIHMQQMGPEWKRILFEDDLVLASSDPLHRFIPVDEIPDPISRDLGSMEELIDQRREELMAYEREMQDLGLESYDDDRTDYDYYFGYFDQLKELIEECEDIQRMKAEMDRTMMRVSLPYEEYDDEIIPNQSMSWSFYIRSYSRREEAMAHRCRPGRKGLRGRNQRKRGIINPPKRAHVKELL